MFKFKIIENIMVDIDIVEEFNDFGNNGDWDFFFY